MYNNHEQNFVNNKNNAKMADEDEIDILGDFSFNSCFAQNNQGIPSCSSREDTVHPQWLLDSTETNNWYDKQSKDLQSLKNKSGPSRKLLGDHTHQKFEMRPNTVWSQAERNKLAQEMVKYGRNVKKISQYLKSKTEVEIQTLIDAEFGVRLEPSTYGLEKYEDHADVPSVVQEEIVTDDGHYKSVVTPTTKHPFRKKSCNVKPRNSLLKPNIEQLINSNKIELIDSSEIFYEDDMIIGSTESIGSELDMTDIVSKNIAKHQAKVKAEKKIGNHRRKVSRNYDKGVKSKDLLKSPQARQRKDSGLSEESKSPKMQIVLGSGQALPVSEGEQVIKIEKKKDSEPESDIEIDVDSDNEDRVIKNKSEPDVSKSKEPIAVPLSKFEPMPRRQKKINLDGGGGYTIMHTPAGDLYAVGSEPRRRERAQKKPPIHLIRCRFYNAEKPAPYDVSLHVSALILMDAHAHSSRAEVMGLAGGAGEGRALSVRAYRRARAAAGSTHCDMDPVSQAQAAESISAMGLSVIGWHHSHPEFDCEPSAVDLMTQRALQQTLEWRVPILGLITSQHWPAGRRATQYKCFRVEEEEAGVGYQLRVRLVGDVSACSVGGLLADVRAALAGRRAALRAVCPRAGLSYLDKCISSITHHMRSAGYADDDPVIAQLVAGLRDVVR